MSIKSSLPELRVFIALAESGHFTRAAERLGVSQSTLSAALVKLERVLGTRLFDRHTRACRLTEAGAALLPEAHRLVAGWDQWVADARDFARLSRGRVTVAAPNAQCAMLLPQVMRRFQESFPGVRVLLHDVPENEVHTLVRNGAADLGIATQTEARTDLVTTVLDADEFVVVLRPDHPLAHKRGPLDWEDLCAHPLIGYLPGNPVRRLLEDHLGARGVTLSYAYEIGLPWTVMGLAREGLGVAVVTRTLQPLADWHQLVLRPVGRPPLARMLTLFRPPGGSPSPAVAAFRDVLLQAAGVAAG
ncbi:MAG TPA: LysR family transcriptional regulator [Ottowia sp.]|uniref:LysR family transcriptional regulator n=1 Tax=Ottowia sp. TaxID=1898956 RepID=UPI002BD01851|nr:LysR family transcriptional regulator [Ottowia sp.]HMN22061.1 LysR family transcriptional regulator [Ottowia sp.]